MKIINRLGILCLATLSLVACKEKEEVKEEILRPVQYQVVATGMAEETRTFSGLAKSSDEIVLSFRSSGIIEQVNVTRGQQVKKGELIAKLDNVEASLAYEQAVSSVNSAKSALNTSQNERDRIRVLYEKGSKSLAEYEKARNAYETALAQYESAVRNRGIQSTQLSYGIIKAPKDGLLTDFVGEVGERVSSGHEFATLNAGTEMKIELGLPESLVNNVDVGMKTSVVFSAIKDSLFMGTVIELAPAASADASTYKTFVGINNPTDDIKSGMAANVTFSFKSDTQNTDDLIIVPVKAVGEDGDGNFVLLIDSSDQKTGAIKKQTITLDGLTTNGFIVKSGLSEGQYIATAGLQTLLEGQQVSLEQPNQ